MSVILVPRKYGCKKDKKDKHDLLYTLEAPIVLPGMMDNRKYCHAVRDQGQEGSCTGFAGTGALDYDRIRRNMTPYDYSPQYLYYWTRQKERLPFQPDGDNGATIRDTIKTARNRGVCSEQSWPYTVDTLLVQPPAECDAEAAQHKILVYKRVTLDMNLIKSVFASEDPLVFGIKVYTSFESAAVARTGKVPMPNTKKERFLGGHALLGCGYDNDGLIVQNSWSDQWGDHGYCYIPWDYILSSKLTNDLWTVKTVQ